MSVTKVTDAMRNVTAVDATKISGAVPSASLTNVDLSKLEYNQAILAFKIASANQLAKFQMVDQVIDEYQDATGIDASASINESAGGATTAKYYDGSSGAYPTGGASVDTSVSGYRTHVFTGNASLVVSNSGNVDILVVAGGGSGGLVYGGGGGAGGLVYKASHGLTANTYDAVIGNGGAGLSGQGVGNVGIDSTWTINGGSTEFTAKGGGGGGQEYSNASSGGSGGGSGHEATGNGSGTQTSQAGDSGTYGFGNNGGVGTAAPDYNPGGGGGAGSVGQAGTTTKSGDGGTGKDMSAIFGTAVGDSGWFASGGGGGSTSDGTTVAGTASSGGGADGAAQATPSSAGQNNTGGGGGGGQQSPSYATGAGGTGVVLVRYSTSTFKTVSNITLQSVATTAESAPTKADLVLLIEDSGSGTATINTDIKAKVSRDGTDFGDSYVTLVDEGDWGTDKRILVARNIDLTASHDTGTAMKYKIETFNQSTGVKETRIHATSLAWA